MFVKVVFILGLFAVATSVLPFERKCDPTPKRPRTKPTLCSNFFNIEHIYKKEKTLEEKQSGLQEKIAAVKNTGDSNHDDLVRLTAQLQAFEKRLSSIEEAKDDNSDKVSSVSDKVAFSAQIVDGYNMFTGLKTASTVSTLIFNKVFTNVGNAYDSKTGIFMTTVEGVYMFSFMTFSYHTHTSGVMLLKNGKRVVSTWESRGWGSTSSTVVLEMKVKECVSIALQMGGKVHKAIFSGFLIYPMK
ncbi:cerebellin-2-like isoform X1 [Embiotoca jacksoni]|uniref:cerebellin-2-like isoform X1 n=1 Tax=Embiotoca jacksoni TaxID=100190 RepID=UPI003703CFAE